MSDERGWIIGSAAGATLLGGLLGAVLGIVVGGFVGYHSPTPVSRVERSPHGGPPGPSVKADELALFDSCAAFVGAVIGAVVGGIAAAIGGSVLGAILGTSLATRIIKKKESVDPAPPGDESKPPSSD
jgi:hypothetical protein